MNEPPLFPGFTDGTVQWRAETMQLVNWGGFAGHHQIAFDADTTLIAGPTGSGKSTILDAYTALMMPSRVPFNSASNEATIGRARSEEQRSVLSYLRGKVDMSQDESGTRVDQVLRGHDATVWGGIAMTFRADDDQRFSAIRVYLAQPSASRDSEVLKRMFTHPAAIDLRAFHELHTARFQAHVVKAAFPGIEAHDDNYSAFSEELFRKLGIAGELKALELLARVQAGKQVRDVTSLFSDLVLEKPQTYDMADRASGHFSDLERLYDAIAMDAEKQQLLAPMVDLYERHTAASSEVERLDTFGVRHPTDQPFDLWATRHQLSLCRAEIVANGTARDDARATLHDRQVAVSDRNTEREQAERELREGGGESITRLRGDIESANARLQVVITNRGTFDAQTAVLDVTPSTAATYDELRAAARPFLERYESEEQTLNDRTFEVRSAGQSAQLERAELAKDLESFRERDSLVPRRFAEARARIADACHLDVSELPFAAELMDLRSDCEDWRTAAEVTLRGAALTMLMDERRQAEIRRRIDPLELGLRLNFDGVDLADHRSEPEDPDYISGRLQFKDDSPFVSWVKRRVYGEDHLCVDSAGDLGGDGRKVTRSGQTSSGSRGAHGRDRNHQNILGFSNEARCREIELQIAALDTHLAELVTAVTSLADEAKRLRFKQSAYQYIDQHRWEEIDVAGARQHLSELESRLEDLLADNETLSALERLAVEARTRHEDAIADRTRAEGYLNGLHRAWEQLVEDEDALSGTEAQLMSSTALSDEVAAELDTRLADSSPEALGYGPAIINSLRALRASLRSELALQETRVQELAAGLTQIFREYNRRWPDPNRSDAVLAYEQFEEIYAQIVGTGLFSRKEEFQRKVTEWASRDLIQLRAAYSDATRDVVRRLDPINETLSHLPFGAGRERLTIAMRERRPEQVRVFLTELHGLTDRLTDDLSYEDAEQRYVRLLAFMKRLRVGDAETPSHRDALLDVRRHIEITARRIDAQGRELSTYTTLSGKSGGESQELIAFIAGAALRFQMADDTERKPRFAPVFLDEGFVKADSEHAGRAVEAWRELGFQLILAVPLDKVTGLDRHVQSRLSVNKFGSLSRVTELREHREPAAV